MYLQLNNCLELLELMVNHYKKYMLIEIIFLLTYLLTYFILDI